MYSTSIPDRELGIRLRLDLALQRPLGLPDSRIVEHWGAKLVLQDAYDEEDTEVLGSAHIVRCALGVPDMVEMLDGHDADLGAVAGVVLTARTGEPIPALEATLGGFGDRLLILNTVELEPQWRGRGIGRWFAAEALESLSGGALFAATMAASFEECEGLERKRAELKLRRVWAEIGFEPVAGNIMVLDLRHGRAGGEAHRPAHLVRRHLDRACPAKQQLPLPWGNGSC